MKNRILDDSFNDLGFGNSIVLQINGDSMEPNYFNGTTVQCEEILMSDWHNMNCAVYAIMHSNSFTVKRVKSCPKNGALELYSDNTASAGIARIPLKKVRRIWKVTRILDAPAR